MKGTIIEKKRNHWIVLDEKGRFRKVSIYQTLGLEIGDEMELAERKTVMNWRSAMSAALIAFFLMGVGIYQTPYGFMVVDINPSTELVYNRFQRVIGVNPLNEDAKAMLSFGLKHHRLERAVQEIVEEAKAQGYLEDDGFVLLTSQERTDQIDEQAFVEALYNKLMEDGLDLTIAALESSEEEYKLAKGIGVSPGKEILKEQIRTQKGEIKASGGSVGALIREVNRLTKPTKEEKDEARLIMQEQKREKIQKEEVGEKTPPGQAKKENNQNGSDGKDANNGIETDENQDNQEQNQNAKGQNPDEDKGSSNEGSQGKEKGNSGNQGSGKGKK